MIHKGIPFIREFLKQQYCWLSQVGWVWILESNTIVWNTFTVDDVINCVIVGEFGKRLYNCVRSIDTQLCAFTDSCHFSHHQFAGFTHFVRLLFVVYLLHDVPITVVWERIKSV